MAVVFDFIHSQAAAIGDSYTQISTPYALTFHNRKYFFTSARTPTPRILRQLHFEPLKNRELLSPNPKIKFLLIINVKPLTLNLEPCIWNTKIEPRIPRYDKIFRMKILSYAFIPYSLHHKSKSPSP